MNNLNHSRLFSAWFFAPGLLLASVGSALAAARYVDVNSTNSMWPYTSWATAASGIQEAIEVAVAGDEIVVTNGTYSVGGRSTLGQPTTTNRVVVDKPLALRSVNGPQFTIIDGRGVFRCVYLTNDASLSGFTLTNGLARSGGGAYGGTLNNCTLSGNWADDGGGAYSCTLNNCTLSQNSASWKCCWVGGYGGGAYLCVLNSCTLSGNVAIGWRDSQGFFGGGGGAAFSTLNSCTLTANWTSGWGGRSGGGAYDCTLNNCIVYYNASERGSNYDSSSILNYSCTTPLPTNGVGNITNEPAFVNFAAGNYRLRPDSPCIDAGTNLSASITNDLDGRPRPLDGKGDGLAAFDMGAYEYRTPLLVWQDSPNPTPPHADWASAAHTIQTAVDAAAAGDEIVVTNGIYATGGRDGNRVAVNKPLSLRSVNGPQLTTIDGGHSNRCVSLPNGASISGLTLTNGLAHYGGGLSCESTNALASNCVVSGNSTFAEIISGGFDGPVVSPAFAGGVHGGTLNNCILSDNQAQDYYNPFFAYRSSSGGGAGNATLNYCTLTGNSAAYGGGAAGCTLNNCTLNRNSGSAAHFASGGGGAFNATLNNCTLAGNSADRGGGAQRCTLNNCIVYFNTAADGVNYDSFGVSALNYCCTTPQPTSGIGNITNAPLFVDLASGNLRLQSNSPCINAGRNAFAPAGPDLDGNLRIVGYTVDMGAYESQSAPSIAPHLSFTPSGTNVILAWPTDYAGAFIQGNHYEAYFLYSTTNLVSPVVWRFVYPPPVVVNGQLVVTNTIDGTQRFYRIARETGPLGDVPCLLRGPNPCPCAYKCVSGVWTEYAQRRNCDDF